jgi:ribosomal protein L37AE/L43A
MITPDGLKVSPAPSACPFCGSSKVTTAREMVDTSTYWRCETCGEVWNAGRLQALNRYHDKGR